MVKWERTAEHVLLPAMQIGSMGVGTKIQTDLSTMARVYCMDLKEPK